MKKVIGLFAVLASLVTVSEAKEYRGFEVSKESEVINVSADKLWQLVGEGFEDAYVWASSVDHSVGIGQAKFEGATCDERSCDINSKGFSKIVEKVIKYDVPNKSFAYAVTDGMPGFMHSATNDWTVVAVGANQSKLIMGADFKVKGLMGFLMKGIMEKKMNKLLLVVLNDAKVYVETGQPSEEKMARIHKLSKKNKSLM